MQATWALHMKYAEHASQIMSTHAYCNTFMRLGDVEPGCKLALQTLCITRARNRRRCLPLACQPLELGVPTMSSELSYARYKLVLVHVCVPRAKLATRKADACIWPCCASEIKAVSNRRIRHHQARMTRRMRWSAVKRSSQIDVDTRFSSHLMTKCVLGMK